MAIVYEKSRGLTDVEFHYCPGCHHGIKMCIRDSIGTFQAECLPEDKLTWIDRSQQSGHLVCMVGDGINDAPALKRAHVGIAMGGVGSDIAVDLSLIHI